MCVPVRASEFLVFSLFLFLYCLMFLFGLLFCGCGFCIGGLRIFSVIKRTYSVWFILLNGEFSFVRLNRTVSAYKRQFCKLKS